MGVFDAGSILARLRLDSNSFTSGMLSAGNIARAFGPTVTMFMTNPVLGFMQVGKQVLALFGKQERAEASLAAVLRATGGAAGYTLDQLKEMASGLQETTTYADENILAMQRVIATFKSIKGDTFERTTRAVLDLSAAFDQDLKGSAIQLGKALEDPITGISALGRVGVSFTETQKDQIKAMVEANDVAAAQAVILKTLEEQVGGTAEALGATSSGTLQQFKNLLSDIGEDLGGAIIPLLRSVAQVLSPILKLLRPIVDLIAKIIEYVSRPLGWLGDLLEKGTADIFASFGGSSTGNAQQALSGVIAQGMRRTGEVAQELAVARIRSEQERVAAELAMQLA